MQGDNGTSMTSRKGKGTDKPKAKKLSNPASTGGGGTSFESRVQASRLLAMCLGSPVPGAPEGRIVELRFQARIHGHHTDDLVCYIEQSDGQRARALLQMKRSLTPREKDPTFGESIGAAWTDYKSDDFVRGQDSIYLVYDTASAAAMKGASTVCTWARYSATAGEFLKKVDAEDFSNAANRNALAAVRKIAESYAGQAIDDEVLYDFVKHLNCLPHDLDQDGTAEHVSHLNSIRQATALVGEVAHPQEIWSALVAACMTANGVAGTVTLDNLGNGECADDPRRDTHSRGHSFDGEERSGRVANAGVEPPSAWRQGRSCAGRASGSRRCYSELLHP